MNPDSTDPIPPPFLPVVRYMIVSNDLRIDPTQPQSVDIVGLLYNIRAHGTPPFPMTYTQFCVFLALTDCRGEGEGWLECVNDDTGQRVFGSARYSLSFGEDPLRVIGVRFRLTECPFPVAGMYAVQFWYNGVVLEQKFVRVR
jgi:hypothetical protein